MNSTIEGENINEVSRSVEVVRHNGQDLFLYDKESYEDYLAKERREEVLKNRKAAIIKYGTDNNIDPRSSMGKYLVSLL